MAVIAGSTEFGMTPSGSSFTGLCKVCSCSDLLVYISKERHS